MNTFKSFGLFGNTTGSSSPLDPTRDWLILLISGTIVLTGIVVWNAWAFDTVAGGGTIGTAATSTAPVFSQQSLDAIHTIFADRATEEAKYASGMYTFPDPSL